VPKTYVVQQGDHISQIAEKYDFRSYLTIWDDAANADLRKQRKSPNVLLPGDELEIPDRAPKSAACETTKVHTFQISISKLKLRIAVRDFDNEPMPGLNCEVEVDGSKQLVKTDGNGILECQIARTAKKGNLRVPSLGLETPLLIGHLDPPESDTGWKGRLSNLGYWTATEAQEEDSDERLTYALQEFQCDHALKETGKPDPATIAKLAELHGC